MSHGSARPPPVDRETCRLPGVRRVSSRPRDGSRRLGAGDGPSGAHADGREADVGQTSSGATVAAVGADGPRAPAAVSAAQQQAHIFQ